MGSQEVLKSYLISLGFQIDARSQRVFNQAMKGADIGVARIAQGAVAATAAMTAMTVKVAQDMERMFYQARRMNTSVSSLQNFSFGMEQIGFSGEAAQNALSRFFHETLNPGKRALLQRFGATAEDATVQMRQLVDGLNKFSPGAPGTPGFLRRSAFAGMFGISPEDLISLEKGKGEMAAAVNFRKALSGDSGVDADNLAKQSHVLMRDLGQTEEIIKTIGQMIAADWVEPLTHFVDKLNKGLEEFIKWKHELADKGPEPVEGGTPLVKGGVPLGFWQQMGYGAIGSMLAPLVGDFSLYKEAADQIKEGFERFTTYPATGIGVLKDVPAFTDKNKYAPLFDANTSVPIANGAIYIEQRYDVTITTPDPHAAGAAVGTVMESATERAGNIIRSAKSK